MKIALYLLILFSTLSCKSQVEKTDSFILSISPTIDRENLENKKIISVMENFLKSKNISLSENEFWLESDFEKYTYPYKDIFRIEYGNRTNNDYKPTLMELVDLDNAQKLVKIGFVGFNPNTNESLIRGIYNIIALKSNNKWKLKRAIDYQTKNWLTLKENSITYLMPKDKIANKSEILKQSKNIENICLFFNTAPIDITYYSCSNPKQVFEVKGFDYLPNMYFSKTGGMADYGNIIYSGNNSEFYTHEIVHIYTKKLFPKISNLLDEGIATYIGGSGTYDYSWHRRKMAKYLDTSKLDLGEHLNPYERLYIENETPIPYMIGALICERTYRIYGKEKLFDLLNSENDLIETLDEYGLTKKNITTELKKELKLPPTNLWGVN
jgi:hypothetical protein